MQLIADGSSLPLHEELIDFINKSTCYCVLTEDNLALKVPLYYVSEFEATLDPNKTYHVKVIDLLSDMDFPDGYKAIDFSAGNEYVHVSYEDIIPSNSFGSGGGFRVSSVENHDPVTNQIITKTYNYYGG